MSTKKTVAIIGKSKPELNSVAPDLIRTLQDRKYEVLVDPDTAQAVHPANVKTVERSAIAAHHPGFVIVLGGDGTLLAAARAVATARIPLLAVNLGSLGFLTEVRKEELFTALDAIEQSRCTRDIRAMLQCKVLRRGEQVAEYIALNDVVVTKATIARMSEVDVAVDGQFIAKYRADGVIVSTPTGSTAYSLAAGGPVLEPSVAALVITPISPHALTSRPLVVPDSAEITLDVRGETDETYLTVDGQTGMDLLEGDQIVCRKSEHRVELLRLPGRPFFEVLRTKLKWGER